MKYTDTLKNSTKNLTEESTKESLIDELSKRLSGLEFGKDNSIKSKGLNNTVKNILPTL